MYDFFIIHDPLSSICSDRSVYLHLGSISDRCLISDHIGALNINIVSIVLSSVNHLEDNSALFSIPDTEYIPRNLYNFLFFSCFKMSSHIFRGRAVHLRYVHVGADGSLETQETMSSVMLCMVSCFSFDFTILLFLELLAIALKWTLQYIFIAVISSFVIQSFCATSIQFFIYNCFSLSSSSTIYDISYICNCFWISLVQFFLNTFIISMGKVIILFKYHFFFVGGTLFDFSIFIWYIAINTLLYTVSWNNANQFSVQKS